VKCTSPGFGDYNQLLSQRSQWFSLLHQKMLEKFTYKVLLSRNPVDDLAEEIFMCCSASDKRKLVYVTISQDPFTSRSIGPVQVCDLTGKLLFDLAKYFDFTRFIHFEVKFQ